MKLIDRFNLGREKRAYKKYVRLNVRRKGKEVGGLAIFKKFDVVRRRTGFVK